MSTIFPENFVLQNCLSIKLLGPREFFSAYFDYNFFFRSKIFAFRFGSSKNAKISMHLFTPFLPVRPNSNFQAFFFFFFLKKPVKT